MFLRSAFSLLFLLLPILSNAQGDPASFSVLEDGERVELPDTIQTKIKQSPSSIQYILLRWYAAEGFLNASIDSLHHEKAYIERNCPFR